jgi:hypothetical protein
MKVFGVYASFATLCALAVVPGLSGCSQQAVSKPDVSQIQPYASLQEVMDGIVDPAADELWDTVETTVTKDGIQEKYPHTAQEWADARRKAITLIEASNLLIISGRHVAVKSFPAEAEGALNSAQIEQRLAANRPAFDAFAQALRGAAQKAVTAIDAKDPAALVGAGGDLDGVCEGCHMSFWYPNQVIPPVK